MNKVSSYSARSMEKHAKPNRVSKVFWAVLMCMAMLMCLPKNSWARTRDAAMIASGAVFMGLVAAMIVQSLRTPPPKEKPTALTRSSAWTGLENVSYEFPSTLKPQDWPCH